MNPGRGLHIIREDAEQIVRQLGPRLDAFRSKNVLITGAGGVIGGYVTDALAVWNETQTDRDRATLHLLTRRPVTDESRLAHLRGRDDVRFLVQDISDPVSSSEPLQFIVHTAAPASPEEYRRRPVSAVDANARALQGLLERARNDEAEGVVFLSSSEVYGIRPDEIPTPETYVGRVDQMAGRAFHAEANRFGETLCVAYNEQYGLPVRVARPFHIFGPGFRFGDSRLIPDMIRRGVYGEPLQLLSDGRATRSYGYVLDSARAVLRILLSEGAGVEAYNLGSDESEQSILETVTIISEICGCEVAVKRDDQPRTEYLSGGPQRACPDLSKLRGAFGFEVTVPLREGLARTAEWATLVSEADSR